MKAKYHVGVKKGQLREVFRTDLTPTAETHGQYIYCIGPFRTRRAAEWMADTRGRNNPHCRCVADAERLAKKYKNDYHAKSRTWSIPIFAEYSL